MTTTELAAVIEALAPVVKRYVLEALEGERVSTELALTKALGPLGERIATLEARPPLPGPAGIDGADGAPGPAGPAGRDGAPGLTYCGVYVDGHEYERGAVVTWAGSAWHCHAERTSGKPGDGSPAWQLIVKRGRDGRDAKGAA